MIGDTANQVLFFKAVMKIAIDFNETFMEKHIPLSLGFTACPFLTFDPTRRNRSDLSYKYFEVPFVNWDNKFTRKDTLKTNA